MYELLRGSIQDVEQEAAKAKQYWSSENVHPPFYKTLPHYMVAVREVINFIQPQSVFEFGCGSGRNLAALDENIPENKIIFSGIDINSSLIAAGKKTFSAINIKEGDETTLTALADDSFDLIFTVSALDHLPDPSFVMTELARIAKTFFICIEPYDSSVTLRSERLDQVILSAYTKRSNQSAPYTYLHDYPAHFNQCGLTPLFCIPFPTHMNRTGPIYSLWFLEKNNNHGMHLKKEQINHLHDSIIRNSFLNLLMEAKSVGTASVNKSDVSQLVAKISDMEDHIITMQTDMSALHLMQHIEKEQERSQYESEIKILVKEQETSIARHKDEIAALMKEQALLTYEKNTIEAEYVDEVAALGQEITTLSAQYTAEIEKIVGEKKELLDKIDALISSFRYREKLFELKAEQADKKIQAACLQVESLKKSQDYRVGSAVLAGFRSCRSTGRLPVVLPRLLWKMARNSAFSISARWKMRQIRQIYQKGGFSGVTNYFKHRKISNGVQAKCLTDLSRMIRKQDPVVAGQFALQAGEIDPKPYRIKWAAFRLFEGGALIKPHEMLEALPDDVVFSTSEQNRSFEIAGLVRLMQNKPELGSAYYTEYQPGSQRMMYVAASSQPYHLSGYTRRTHELLRALMKSGLDVKVVTRPGYPWDRSDRLMAAQGNITCRDGINYHHIRSPERNLPLDYYWEDAAAAIIDHALQVRPAVIHAASDYVNAMPALIAARSLGVPFHYEMRGLWHMSRASKIPGYETSDHYRLADEMEGFIAKNADRVYAISGQLAQHVIQECGVAENKVSLLPNCVDRRYLSTGKASNIDRAHVRIGYAGSLVSYEGLDILLEAIQLLGERNIQIGADIVGDGPMRAPLTAMAKKLGIANRVVFHGLNPLDAAHDVLFAADMVCLPRKPHPVCELMPPLKLVEAMALGKPVIVSDLPVLLDEIEHGKLGQSFRAGDATNLADVIEQAVINYSRTSEIAQKALLNVSENRQWDTYAEEIFNKVSALGLRPKSSPDQPDKSQNLVDNKHARYLAAMAALKQSRSQKNLRAAFWACHHVGNIDKLHLLGREIIDIAEKDPNAIHPKYVDKIRSSSIWLLDKVKQINDIRCKPLHNLKKNVVAYVLHNSLPFSTGGYATRAHGVAVGLANKGYKIHPISRYGYPIDTLDGLEKNDIKKTNIIDGVKYTHVFSNNNANISLVNYVDVMADIMESKFRKMKPSVIIAASAYKSALPTLIAAKKLGIPFIYEVRGFWEITRLSRDPAYKDTVGYKIAIFLETFVAQNAVHVFTLTNGMKNELIKRGIESKKISLVPNSCDTLRFSPKKYDRDLANKYNIPDSVPIIGYIGTFVHYEGLEDLAKACALLKSRGIPFRLLLVGNENVSSQSKGSISENIIEIAKKNNFDEWLIMPGRVPHEAVKEYYSLVDIAVFPRKSFPVTEIVSPMKPLEACAMEKAVLVSSVGALKEMIKDEVTGLVFEKDNIERMSDALQRLIESSELRQKLGKAAREWVINNRSWEKTIQSMQQKIDQTT